MNIPNKYGIGQMTARKQLLQIIDVNVDDKTFCFIIIFCHRARDHIPRYLQKCPITSQPFGQLIVFTNDSITAIMAYVYSLVIQILNYPKVQNQAAEIGRRWQRFSDFVVYRNQSLRGPCLRIDGDNIVRGRHT